jgi:hypothetical protein
MNIQVTPGPIGIIIAVLVILFAALMMMSVVPFTHMIVGGLLLMLGIARLT